MDSLARRRTPILLILVAAAVLAVPKTASAQFYEMSFSYYFDIAWDGTTVYGVADGYDMSWGCSHGGYYASGWLNGPTHGTSGDGWGTGSSLDVPFNGDDGTWTVGVSITFACSCVGSAGAGNSQQQNLVRYPKWVKRIGTQTYTQGPPAPYVFVVNREILDQFGKPLERVMFVDESFSPDPPNGTCTSQPVAQGDANSNAAGIFGPDFYTLPGNAPNPCSSSSRQSFVIDGHAIETTYDITWQYSGVSVQANNEP
jgi:hypothetical protein